jgi:hypothetical protein
MALIGARLYPVGSRYDAIFRGRYSSLNYEMLAHDMGGASGLPRELVDIIFDLAGHIVWEEVAGTRMPRTAVSHFSDEAHTASQPLADGSCPFTDKLPAEIRRKIFIDELNSLPSHHKTIYPTCGTFVESSSLSSTRTYRTNRMVAVMLLNKKICNEIAEAVYEERTFAIHVHQGLENSGIEFLNVGRQPLQYLDSISDGRFTRFQTNDMFGFGRLKKIEIHIFPYDGDHHHTAISTYFMNIALARLLERNTENGANRITFIRILFPTQDTHKKIRENANPTVANCWWDATKDRPCETSIHGISDIELVLRPFARLSHVHRVEIQLPELVSHHVRSIKFVRSLVHCMTVQHLQNAFNNDNLDRKIESARFALEDYIRNRMYCGQALGRSLKLTDEELEEELGSPSDDDADDVNDGNSRKDDDDSDDDDDDDDDENDDNDNMKPAPKKAASTNQSSSDKRDGNAKGKRPSWKDAKFNDDGGYPEDLSSDEDDDRGDYEPFIPNGICANIDFFIGCFSVTEEVARLYLDLSRGNLETASELYTTHPDSSAAAIAVLQRVHFADGPVIPNNVRRGGARSGNGNDDMSRTLATRERIQRTYANRRSAIWSNSSSSSGKASGSRTLPGGDALGRSMDDYSPSREGCAPHHSDIPTQTQPLPYGYIGPPPPPASSSSQTAAYHRTDLPYSSPDQLPDHPHPGSRPIPDSPYNSRCRDRVRTSARVPNRFSDFYLQQEVDYAFYPRMGLGAQGQGQTSGVSSMYQFGHSSNTRETIRSIQRQVMADSSGPRESVGSSGLQEAAEYVAMRRFAARSAQGPCPCPSCRQQYTGSMSQQAVGPSSQQQPTVPQWANQQLSDLHANVLSRFRSTAPNEQQSVRPSSEQQPSTPSNANPGYAQQCGILRQYYTGDKNESLPIAAPYPSSDLSAPTAPADQTQVDERSPFERYVASFFEEDNEASLSCQPAHIPTVVQTHAENRLLLVQAAAAAARIDQGSSLWMRARYNNFGTISANRTEPRAPWQFSTASRHFRSSLSYMQDDDTGKASAQRPSTSSNNCTSIFSRRLLDTHALPAQQPPTISSDRLSILSCQRPDAAAQSPRTTGRNLRFALSYGDFDPRASQDPMDVDDVEDGPPGDVSMEDEETDGDDA